MEPLSGGYETISIQIQGGKRQVSIRIFNIRYWEDPEQNCQTLYDKVVAKAQDEIRLLRLELQIQIKNQDISTSERHGRNTT